MNRNMTVVEVMDRNMTHDRPYFRLLKLLAMAVEQQITISFHYGMEDLSALHQLSAKLDHFLKENGLGEVDGHEVAMDLSHGFLYLYGPSAEAMFKGIRGLLSQAPFMKGATAKLKFKNGRDDYPELEILLDRSRTDAAEQ